MKNNASAIIITTGKGEINFLVHQAIMVAQRYGYGQPPQHKEVVEKPKIPALFGNGGSCDPDCWGF